jgi:putative membrane protein
MKEASDKQINKDLILRERLAIQRTVMANYTTLLSFIRTALYFAVAGLTLHNLLDIRYGLLIEIISWIISAGILITGIVNYKRHQQKIRESERHVGNYQLDYERDL